MQRVMYAAVAVWACSGPVNSAVAQDRLDQADPTITEQSLPKPSSTIEVAPQPQIPVAEPLVAGGVPADGLGRVATAIIVQGSHELAPSAFNDVVLAYVGKDLSRADLAELAGAVAAAARARGYPLATASIPAQEMQGGVLRVELDEGRIDAVRVVGANNPLADRILTRALVTQRPTRRSELERAIALVGDIPGVTVKESRFLRQDGFGILLVTIEIDRASGYAQFDNRGSKEIGPIRSTLIGNVRAILQPGDELGLVASQTPLQASEFEFIRARYSAPIDSAGSVLSVSGSYGRANPGASLSSLDVIGHSVDLAVAYSRPLSRSRQRSLWGTVEFRTLRIDQNVFGIRLRDDHLATLTGTLNGTSVLAKGNLRGEIGVAVGLPFAGVTHAGDPLASRPDGDARFVTAGYAIEWSVKLNPWLGLVINSAGQVASRPLLATAEIGVGGPGFARAFDNSERTGDQGILGSLELRADAGRVLPGVIDRLQIYGFVDGGAVDNLRGGTDGGALAAAGGGIRFGLGRLDAMAEIAAPLNTDRFDTGNRQPRISARLSRSF